MANAFSSLSYEFGSGKNIHSLRLESFYRRGENSFSLHYSRTRARIFCTTQSWKEVGEEAKDQVEKRHWELRKQYLKYVEF